MFFSEEIRINTEKTYALYQVDAFTQDRFGGNPAAVVLLDTWIADSLLQSIAAENNLAETAFVVPGAEHCELRWFTPTAEVALCGHATLAAAWVMFRHQQWEGSTITFETRESGQLGVTLHQDHSLSMSFPAIPMVEIDLPDNVSRALGAQPISVWTGHYTKTQFDYVAVFENEKNVADLAPDLPGFKELDSRGIIATARGNTHDFVSRYFAPNFGIDEDPVTGSAHCLLAPWWAGHLNTHQLTAAQISERGSDIRCTIENNRVLLRGFAVDFLRGEIYV